MKNSAEMRLASWGWIGATLFAFAVFLGHARWFAGWIVDDAGISFAYARSVAGGLGFVAQPGAARVEGVTNLLWTLLLAVPMRWGGFDVVGTPKALSALCVLVAFGALSRELSTRHGQPAPVVALALSATAAATPFVAWSLSGLENALATLLVGACLVATLRAMETTGHAVTSARRSAGTAGLLVFLYATTRPEGVLLLPATAFLLGAAARASAGHASASKSCGVRVLTRAFVLPWTALVVARVAYFGDVLPNTYYAKVGPGSTALLWCFARLGFPVTVVLFLLGTVGGAVAAAEGAERLGRRWSPVRRLGAVTSALAVFTFASYVAFELLPGDWMPEHRFATPLFLLLPLLVVGALVARAPRRDAAAMLAGACLLAAAAAYSGHHTPAFVASPALRLSAVRDMARRLSAAASAAGLERPLVLLPDIGGALWEDRFQVLDLVGLTDREIGRRLRRDREAFRRHVLGERRPQLIWTHGYWSRLADWRETAGFASGYVTAWSSSPGADADAVYLRSDLAAHAEAVGAAFAAWRERPER